MHPSKTLLKPRGVGVGLLGVALENPSLRATHVGISGGCASMRNAPDLRIQGTFPIFIVLRGILPLPHFIL